jgi:hypothetical protein
MPRTVLPRPTLGDLHRTTPWLWLYCEGCPHYAPLACAVTLVAGTSLMLTLALAATDADAAALKQATADCRAQVKEQARFEEMSWYARHKAVKNCVNKTMAKH